MSKEKDRKLIKTMVLIAVILITVSSVVYAQIKASEAEESFIEAKRQTELANQQAARAEKLSEVAQKSAAEALKVEAEKQIILELLKECQDKK